MKRKLFASAISTAFLFVLAVAGVNAQIASGGTYSLQQAVVGNGGGSSSGGTYSVQGTAGQAAAGTNMYSATYVALNGFWNNLLVPTAASARIEGRVVDAEGNAIRNLAVILSGAPLTTPRIVKTNSFGSFVFEDVAVGETYVISVSSKKFGFGQPSRVISLNENVADIVFQASWEN
ncbi:MAG TPA: carboxypeptidase-like regulatory domain-containing protein [Pyrinomonadaceae bacterium]|nr:carboxypeptidase-like regulatory domain-containing protein [Pyrinomonadaceae bacterium]